MTAQTRKKLAEMVMSALLTLLATLFVLFGTGAWASKENTSDHAADIRAVIEMQQRTLDVVCDGQKASIRAARACAAPPPTITVRKP